MGLFSRRKEKAEDEGRDQGPRPVDPESVDLVEARAVVSALVQAIGSDAQMRRALRWLQKASGMPDPDNDGAVMAAFEEDRHVTTRLWRWLRAAAARANQVGQSDVAVRAAFWADVWNTTVVPHMVGADFITLGFDRPPADELDELLKEGGVAIAELEDEFVVAQTAEPMTVTAAMLRAAFPGPEAARAGIDAEDEEKAHPTGAESSASSSAEAVAAPTSTQKSDRETESRSGPSEAELREGDEAGDALSARRLGELLLEKGDLDGAEAAYRRAENRGDGRATMLLGFLAEDHRKDLAAAEEAYRRADAAGDVNGSGNLGELLRRQGELREAEQAFRRCVERGGDSRALSHFAGLMSQRGDATPAEICDAVTLLCKAEDLWILAPEGKRDIAQASPALVLTGVQERCEPTAVEAGYRAADEQGSASGAYHLGLALYKKKDYVGSVEASRRAGERGYAKGWAKAAFVLHELGNLDAAEANALRGDEAADGESAALLGVFRDERGDTDGGLEAYRRADARGHPGGSFNLGVELANRGDLCGAEEAFERAADRGEGKAADALRKVRYRLGLT